MLIVYTGTSFSSEGNSGDDASIPIISGTVSSVMLLIIIVLLCVAIMCVRSSSTVTVTIDSKSTHNDMVECELHSNVNVEFNPSYDTIRQKEMSENQTDHNCISRNDELSSPLGVNITVIPNPLHSVATIGIVEDGNVLTSTTLGCGEPNPSCEGQYRNPVV